MRTFADLLGARPPNSVEQLVVYGGDEPQTRTDASVLPWSKVHTYDWAGTAARDRA